MLSLLTLLFLNSYLLHILLVSLLITSKRHILGLSHTIEIWIACGLTYLGELKVIQVLHIHGPVLHFRSHLDIARCILNRTDIQDRVAQIYCTSFILSFQI